MWLKQLLNTEYKKYFSNNEISKEQIQVTSERKIPELLPEIWMEVLDYLETKEILNFGKVSRKFNDISKKSRVWEKIAKSYFSSIPILQEEESYFNYVMRNYPRKLEGIKYNGGAKILWLPDKAILQIQNFKLLKDIINDGQDILLKNFLETDQFFDRYVNQITPFQANHHSAIYSNFPSYHYKIVENSNFFLNSLSESRYRYKFVSKDVFRIKESKKFLNLIYLSAEKNVNCLKLLLKYLKNENDQSEIINNALHCAAGAGNLPCVEYLLSLGATDTENSCWDSYIVENLEYFVSINSSYDPVQVSFFTAAQRAITRGSLEIAYAIFASNQTDRDQLTILILESIYNNKFKENAEQALVHILNTHYSESSDKLLIHGIKFDNAFTIKFCIEHSNLDINKTYNDIYLLHSIYLLHYAVKENRKKAIKILLELGADPNLADEYDNVPMFYACDVEAIQLLKNTDINKVDKNNFTMLDNAVVSGNINLVTELIKMGAKITDAALDAAHVQEKTQPALALLIKLAYNEQLHKESKDQSSFKKNWNHDPNNNSHICFYTSTMQSSKKETVQEQTSFQRRNSI